MLSGRALHEVTGGDVRALRGYPPRSGEQSQNRRKVRSGADLRRDAHAEFSDPRGVLQRRAVPHAPGQRRAEETLRSHRRGASGTPGLRVRRYQRDGVCRVFPDRRGLCALCQGERDFCGAWSRFGRRQPGRLHPENHRHRPDQAFAALRALFESGARQHAGYRHRLRRHRPRQDHPLRGREVRRGERLAGDHLRDDGGQGGDPRCGTRAGDLFRRGGPDRQAGAQRTEDHPGRGDREGPRTQADGRVEGRERPTHLARPQARGAGAPRLGARRRGDHSAGRHHRLRAALQGAQGWSRHHPVRRADLRGCGPAEDGFSGAQGAVADGRDRAPDPSHGAGLRHGGDSVGRQIYL